MIILNDIHLGVNRVSGTTPQSREDLRSYVFSRFSELLRAADGHDLCILGDLFDGFEIPARDWLDAYFLLSEWCENNPDSRLYLVAGNHDVSLKGNKVSAFTTLSQVLLGRFDNVVVTNIDGTYTIGNPGKYAFIVAHHRNQELFDLTLDRVLTACRTRRPRPSPCQLPQPVRRTRRPLTQRQRGTGARVHQEWSHPCLRPRTPAPT